MSITGLLPILLVASASADEPARGLGFTGGFTIGGGLALRDAPAPALDDDEEPAPDPDDPKVRREEPEDTEHPQARRRWEEPSEDDDHPHTRRRRETRPAQEARLLPPRMKGLVVALATAGGPIVRLSRSGRSETTGGFMASLRVGTDLSRSLALLGVFDQLVFPDIDDCGDCVSRAPGFATAIGVALRYVLPDSRVWVEGGIALAIHGVGAAESVSAGPGLILGGGIDLYRSTNGALALSLQASPMYFAFVSGDYLYQPTLIAVTLGLGYLWY